MSWVEAVLINLRTGDTWHANKERIPLDNQRNNDLEVFEWSVLRFNSKQINEQLEDYCLRTIQEMINHSGGLSDEGLVPRVFFTHQGKSAQQLTLFEKPEQEYETGEAAPFEID